MFVDEVDTFPKDGYKIYQKIPEIFESKDVKIEYSKESRPYRGLAVVTTYNIHSSNGVWVRATRTSFPKYKGLLPSVYTILYNAHPIPDSVHYAETRYTKNEYWGKRIYRALVLNCKSVPQPSTKEM